MLDFLIYPAAFLVMLGVLVTFHEYGHYQMARWMGVKVLRFCVGFGRPVWSRKIGRDQTEWALALIPLGGYVKMLDEREGEVADHEKHRAFNRQKIAKRMAIVAAGPFANLLLAFLIYWGVFLAGVETPPPVLGEPPPSSIAAAAGFQNADRILAVEGTTVQGFEDFVWQVTEHLLKKETLLITVQTEQKTQATRALPVSSLRGEAWDENTFFKLGFRPYTPKIPPVIERVLPDSPADRAGLKPDDLIVSINDDLIETWQDLVARVGNAAGHVVTLEYERKSLLDPVFIDLTPDAVEMMVGGEKQIIGRIGAVAKFPELPLEMQAVLVRSNFLEGATKSAKKTWDTARFTLKILSKMITGEVSWRNLSGPISIVDYAGKSAKMGASQYASTIALLSISLFILNLLPIPVLDGGHLLYDAAEILRGKPLSERMMEMGQRVGMTLLFTLMLFAIYNDLSRFF